ncbi:MAG: acyloxyacyl hydrolase [Alphaproteobacteria bacterium]
MRKIVLAALLGGALGWSGWATPAHANKPVTGIAVASAPIVLWALFEEQPTTRDPDLLTVTGGWFDVVQQTDNAALFGLEYRSNLWVWKAKPFVGTIGTSEGSFYAYAGLRLDAYILKRFIISTSLAPTFYARGGGKDLGSAGVLRSGIEIGYRFDNQSQIGLAFHHMSHGKVFSNINPGVETAEITYSIPLSKLFGK